ncbi:MAG: phenylacetate--CoA ligase family protein, partial [Bacteroidales bacterium]|nr:phenylacetate--CoA ligase family protein [Bacteroidales bacterium]
FDPQKFKSLKDLQQIPLLDKESIRKNPEKFIADHRSTIHGSWRQTTGSTGTPLKLFLDSNCHINKYAATLRAYHWAGYSPGKRAFLLVDPEGLKKDFGYRLTSNSIVFDTRSVNPENAVKFYPLLKRFKPNYYIGYGRAFLHLYKYLLESKLKITSPKSMVHYGENLQENDRIKLEEVYRTKVYNFYSHREDTVIAAEPEPGKKYLMEDFYYPEILSDSNQIIEEGTGELIGTGFYNYTMPLIRYKTTDILTVKKFSEANDHKFTQVDKIVGRINDKVITPSGREFYFVGQPIFEVPGIISAQYIQESTDSLKINLLTDDAFSMESIEQLKKNYLEYLGEPMTFDIQLVDELEERGTGKRPVIISRLD